MTTWDAFGSRRLADSRAMDPVPGAGTLSYPRSWTDGTASKGGYRASRR
jgi:hypothetical protein